MMHKARQLLSRLGKAAGKTIGKVVSAVEELVWPRGFQCLCCEKQSFGESLCQDCRKSLAGLRLEKEAGDVRSVWKYAGCAKKLVTELKFNCSGDCAEVLAKGIADVIRQMRVPANAILTWVTMPPKRMRDRGIDHGQALCRCVAEITGMEMRQLLDRGATASTQRGLNKEQRLANLRNAFVIREKWNGPVLIVDDVLTTGATIRACTEALLEGGASRVYVVTATGAELTKK